MVEKALKQLGKDWFSALIITNLGRTGFPKSLGI